MTINGTLEVNLNRQYVSKDGRLLHATQEVKYGFERWVIYQTIRKPNGSVEKNEVKSRWSEEDIKTQLFLEVNKKKREES